MDWGSIAGLVLALGGLLLSQVLDGGRLGSLAQPSAFMIVVIGTIGAVLLQCGMQSFMRGVRMGKLVFSPPPDRYRLIARDISVWSTVARREGLLSLERYLEAVKEPFAAKGLRMVIDGIDPFKLKDILEVEISGYEKRERQAVKVWEAAGGYAPTIGIIGAVLGLIHVMENLGDPSKLGTGIAVAFVSTIYGVGLANLVFLPIANKLKMIVGYEVTQREMLVDALFGIALGDSPHLIQERITAYQR